MWLQEYQQKMFPWGNVLPLMAYIGELCPKGVPFFRPQEYPDKRVSISLIEVYERVGKSLSFKSVKGPKKGWQIKMAHPRRPRGSQSGREKRRDESFQAWKLTDCPWVSEDADGCEDVNLLFPG